MDPSLVTSAAKALRIENLTRVTEGGQKYVARGNVGTAQVVLKVIELGTHAEVTLERARREVDLLARVDHPNVVKVISNLRELGGSPPTGVAWLEEYLDGEDLSSRLHVPWDWDVTAAMALDVAQGLSALHMADAVHRDLSPRNIRCRVDGSYTVMDPGLARHLRYSTLTGTFQPGTWGYMTPEHVAGVARPIPASDVFGVGILMYRALTGDVPIPVGADFDRYRMALRDDQAPSILTARPDLTATQAEVVDTCLQRQSARRYIDGAELVAALEAL
jgi:serine/threonine protein kinase